MSYVLVSDFLLSLKMFNIFTKWTILKISDLPKNFHVYQNIGDSRKILGYGWTLTVVFNFTNFFLNKNCEINPVCTLLCCHYLFYTVCNLQCMYESFPLLLPTFVIWQSGDRVCNGLFCFNIVINNDVIQLSLVIYF